MIVHGIKNCDTCRKAQAWLRQEGIEFRFHDFRVDGLDVNELDRWIDGKGWEVLLNRRGTTWRRLDPSEKEGLDESGARALMAANPTLIKRPVFVGADLLEVGFGETQKEALKG